MKDINLFRTEGSIYLKRVKSKAGVSKDDDCDGYLIDSSEKEARKIIASLKDKKFKGKVGVVGGDDAFNRRVIETLNIDYLVSPERGLKKDTLKQRDSGINHVVAKLAKEKGVLIVVNMNEVSRLKGKEKALRLGRIIQNVKICRKAGCGIMIGSFGSKKSEVFGEKERRAFGVSLGMSSVQSRDCVLF
jgi:RNase P/RNase MRP subunit p30